MSYRHPSLRSVEFAPAHDDRRHPRARPLQGVPIRCSPGLTPVWTGRNWVCGVVDSVFGQMQIQGPPDYLLNWQGSSWDPSTGKFNIPGPPDYLLNWQGSPQLVPENLQALLRPYPQVAAPSIDPFEPPTLAYVPPSPGLLPSPIAPPSPVAPPPSDYAPTPEAQPYDPCQPCYPDVAELIEYANATYCYR